MNYLYLLHIIANNPKVTIVKVKVKSKTKTKKVVMLIIMQQRYAEEEGEKGESSVGCNKEGMQEEGRNQDMGRGKESIMRNKKREGKG